MSKVDAMAAYIFIVGTDPFNMAQLQDLSKASSYRYHSLIGTRDIKCVDTFDASAFLARYRQRLGELSGAVDAIVGYWDFPVSTILPVLRKPLGLPGPSLEAVLGCEHKYLGRIVQKQIVPEMVPAFQAIDPFAPRPTCDLAFPFWLKPVKSVCSHLGFRIGSQEEFERSLAIIRKHIYRFAGPFNIFMNMADLPQWIQGVDGNHCIAESWKGMCWTIMFTSTGRSIPFGMMTIPRASPGINILRCFHPGCSSAWRRPPCR